MVTIEIKIKDSAGTVTARTLSIDPDDIPMQFYADIEEMQDSPRKMAAMLHTYAAAIGFTDEEIRQISRRDWKAIVDAVNGASTDATTIPNAGT